MEGFTSLNMLTLSDDYMELGMLFVFDASLLPFPAVSAGAASGMKMYIVIPYN